MPEQPYRHTSLKTIPAARTILFELLSAYGFNSVQTEEVFAHLDGGSGKVYESHEWRLLRDRKTLVLSRKDEQYKCFVPLSFHWKDV